MIPILFDKAATSFSNNGLGALADCTNCIVTEERNGIYELEMQYPISGIHYELIAYDMLILAKPNETDSPQAFRIYFISRPIGGIVTIRAEHISYQLRHIPVPAFSATSAPEAFSWLSEHAAAANPFTFISDVGTAGELSFAAPVSCRTALTQITSTFGGEQAFDNYNVYLRAARGKNRGVQLLYGKNIVDLTQEENITDTNTGIYPYYADNSGIVELPEKTITAAAGFAYPRISVVDLSKEFESKPTVEQLREKAQEYFFNANIGVPTVSITVDFVNLGDTLDYSELKNLERVCLCDTVTVRFAELGVDTKAKVAKTEYDVLLEKYQKIIIGSLPSTIADTILSTEKIAETAVTTTALQRAIARATELITGNSGGYVVLDPPEAPQRLLIMDTPDKDTAVRVWQWNLNGLGYSRTGINGPYSDYAVTMEGVINANFIAAGTLDAGLVKVVNLSANSITSGSLNADRIKGGKIVSNNGDLSFDLNVGALYTLADVYNDPTRKKQLYISAGGIAWYIVDANGNAVENGGSIAPGDTGYININNCEFLHITDVLRYRDTNLSLVEKTIGGETIKYLGVDE